MHVFNAFVHNNKTNKNKNNNNNNVMEEILFYLQTDLGTDFVVSCWKLEWS